MADTKYINKVVIGGEAKLDLTGDTVTPATLAKGATAHDKSGAPITGTSTKDVDSSGATAGPAEVLSGKTYAAQGEVKTGTMPNQGGKTLNITSKATPVTIPQGYHDGSGKAQIDATEAAKIIANNIRQGITILGVEGSMSGTEGAKAQPKTATPSFSEQVISPDTTSGYNYLSQVTVKAIPVTYVDNEQGGQTVTVG